MKLLFVWYIEKSISFIRKEVVVPRDNSLKFRKLIFLCNYLVLPFRNWFLVSEKSMFSLQSRSCFLGRDRVLTKSICVNEKGRKFKVFRMLRANSSKVNLMLYETIICECDCQLEKIDNSFAGFAMLIPCFAKRGIKKRANDLRLYY